jgi:non-specific serine/threonine protein kinase
LESAQASFTESLTIARELADPVDAIWALEGFAELALARHAPRQAATLLGAIAHLRDETGFLQPVPGETVLADARVTLGADAFDQAWREGSAMELEEAVRYALNGRVAGGT